MILIDSLKFEYFKRQPHEIVKHTQTIRHQIAEDQLRSVFDHFVGLALKGLKK